jgi:hypothetical protein
LRPPGIEDRTEDDKIEGESGGDGDAGAPATGGETAEHGQADGVEREVLAAQGHQRGAQDARAEAAAGEEAVRGDDEREGVRPRERGVKGRAVEGG